MPATLQSLGIDRLPWDELRQLHVQLGDFLKLEGVRTTREQRVADEMLCRLAEYDANPEECCTWEECQAYVRQRLAELQP